MPDMAIIIPVYSALKYAAGAARSALENTRSVRARVFLVDDASPDWDDAGKRRPLDEVCSDYRSRVSLVRFPDNGGLTRSWNHGLRLAAEGAFDFAVVTNSDVVFTPAWELPIVRALGSGGAAALDLAGPVTNAPGTESAQDVRNYLPGYEPSDDPRELKRVADALYGGHPAAAVPGAINGFCMAARTERWWAHAYDAGHVFRPRNDFDSKGRRNPTPLMTLNEYELQARWREAGLRAGFCPGSFVFHYRSVSRGERYAGGQAYRRAGEGGGR